MLLIVGCCSLVCRLLVVSSLLLFVAICLLSVVRN